MKTRLLAGLFALTFLNTPGQGASHTPGVSYRIQDVDGLPIFYREAGDPTKPAIVLLHGFPSSSNMYRDLIPELATRFHVIAPDYPGSGQSVVPVGTTFTPTFDHLSQVMDSFLQQKGLARYTLYMQDFGGPVGMRIAARHPERISALIVQNANSYREGLAPDLAQNIEHLSAGINAETDPALENILSADGVRYMYVQGAHDPARLDPSAWTLDSAALNNPVNKAIQKGFLVDYHNNLTQYPAWQTYLRKEQPPTLIVWGKNDPMFIEAGAHAYLKDLPRAELHTLDTGHFALEEENKSIAAFILGFARRTKLIN